MRAPTSLAGSYNTSIWGRVAAISAPLISLGTQAASGCAPSVEVLPISDVETKKSAATPPKMRAPTSLAGSYKTSIWGRVAAISAPLMSLGKGIMRLPERWKKVTEQNVGQRSYADLFDEE
ncbi:hypothetical protein WN51_00918 [Melipona quadrifasciata]|uniref:Uncharacterized protein n=1 Tax=Melipona quadrifasciata TaxID=166423 RepID=A0A0M8ZVY8_9HYME|nr:hypothetical protein WN51_00918 [Melipona quadrifasciata]